MLIGTAKGLLQVNPVHENAGYLEIKLQEVEIVNQTNTVIHLIDINDINQILDQISENIKNLDIYNKNLLELEIDTIRIKVKTITPSSIRKKRGAINIIGSMYKWLFGTMDEEDREEILGHLETIDQNNHNLISTTNKQISINSYFNDTFTKLKEAIEDDRHKIQETFKEIKEKNNRMAKELFYLDQLSKLKNLEHKIEQIQDNIVASKSNFIHPNIFTNDEILKYNIDFYKLKMLKIGIMNYKENSLIIAIQIPKSYIVTDLRLITPLPNKNFLEIDEEDHFVIEINNKKFEYEDKVALKHLKASKSCIWKNSCKLLYNNKTEIKEIDDETLLIKNGNGEKLIQNCDDRNIVIEKNYFIIFNNCELKIKNETYSNHKEIIKEKYFYPNAKEIGKESVTPLPFQKIISQHFENTEEIKELKFHKKISYGINIVFVILLIIIVIVIFLYKKPNIKIQNRHTIVTDTHELEEIVKKYNEKK